MAHGRLGSGAVVLAILVIAGAGGVVRAQTGTGCAAQYHVSYDTHIQCALYLYGGTTVPPTETCCHQLSNDQNYWGSDCYCDLLLYWQQNPDFDIDMTQAYMLPKACKVPVNTTNCASPPSTSTFPPPPNAALLPPPADLTPTPPGFTAPTTPDFTLPSPPSKRQDFACCSGWSDGGGLTVGAVIIWVVYLIMSKCDMSLKWDLNQPCCCCYRKPKAHPEKPDIYRHNVPANAYGYRV